MNKTKKLLLIALLGCFCDSALAIDENVASEQEEAKTSETEQTPSPMVEAMEEKAEFQQVEEPSEQGSQEAGTSETTAPETIEEAPAEEVTPEMANEEANAPEEQSNG